MISLYAALSFLFVFATDAHAADIVTALNIADGYYQKGDCKNAVATYKAIYVSPAASEDDLDLVIFRTAYCYMQDHQLDAAVIGFNHIVEKFPEQDEAKLRLAQSLFQLERFREARNFALAVEDANFLAEANLVVAQSDIELGDPLDAIKQLNLINVSQDWWPIYYYWLGVARYHTGDVRSASAYFQKAGSLSPPNLWVGKESANWQEQILKENQQWLHGSFSLGYFIDGNIYQQSIISTNSSGVPIENAPKKASYYKDKGYLVSAGLSARLANEQNWNLYSTLNFSSPYYNSYSSYNNQNTSASVGGSLKLSSSWSTDLSVRFLDSRYDAVYYQDYLIATAGLSGMLGRKIAIHFELPYTYYLKTRFIQTYGLGMNARYNGSLITPFVGLNYSKARGSQATYYQSGTFAELLSGTMFTNYESFGRYIGFSAALPWNFYTTLQFSSYTTTYANENLPSGTLQIAYPLRADSLKSYSIELSHFVIPDIWYASLGFTYSINHSTGLQGLVSSEEVTNYNYTRPYWVLSSSVSF